MALPSRSVAKSVDGGCSRRHGGTGLVTASIATYVRVSRIGGHRSDA
jgi:hypothetical protein